MKSITNHHEERLRITRQQYIEDRDNEALQFVMDNELGRWFMMRLLDTSQVFCTTFTGNSETFFREGRRSVGLDMMERIKRLGMRGIEVKQLAEKEYIETQLKFDNMVKDDMKGE